MRFPPSPPPPIHVTHEGPADKASVLLVWPLFVWEPSRLREQRTIELLGDVLQDELIQTVRRKLGKTYSPGVRVSLARGGDQGQLLVQLTTAPGDAQAVIDETRRIVAQLRRRRRHLRGAGARRASRCSTAARPTTSTWSGG